MMFQTVIFHEQTHPNFTCYKQCITLKSFPSYVHEVSYSAFGMIMMYVLPLVVIIYTYTSILMEIYRRTKETIGGKFKNINAMCISLTII